MRRYRFAVEYLGTAYGGWQVQPNAKSVQGELERALSLCLRREVRVTGAGRTDAGVHARGQVAHFDSPEALEPGKTERSVNALTPPDIEVRALSECDPAFHARFSAKSRYYQYHISTRRSPTRRHTVFPAPARFDPFLLAAELANAVGRNDFANFCIPRDDGKSTSCRVLRADVEERRTDGLFIVHLEADRFLHRMVRALVGAAFEVARGRLAPGLVAERLRTAAETGTGPGASRAGTEAPRTGPGSQNGDGPFYWMPAPGLCLEKVRYDDFEF